MDTLISMKVFRQVVESGSFVGAAERLNLSTAMASKHLMHLEKHLGTRLLNRSSRSSSLTESGKLFFERCKVILEEMAEAELAVGSVTGVPRGTVRVSAPSCGSLDRRPTARRPRKGFDTPQLVASANSLRPNLLSSASP